MNMVIRPQKVIQVHENFTLDHTNLKIKIKIEVIDTTCFLFMAHYFMEENYKSILLLLL